MDIRTVTRRKIIRRNVVPLWMKLAIAAAVLVIAALLAAQSTMTGYLKTSEALREAARLKVIGEHPVKYRGLIESYAEQNNLEPAFVAAIIMAESSYRKDAVSSVDARGLMQVKPDTGRWIAGKLGESDAFTPERLFDPETNIRFGTWYLGYLANLFLGDPVLVASAYHAGQTNVQNWVNAGINELDEMGDGPTKHYARKVTTAYGVYQRLYFDVDAEIGAAADQY